MQKDLIERIFHWVGVVIAIGLFMLVLIMGCRPLTDKEQEERAWRVSIDKENWRNCEEVYRGSGRWTLHKNHSHVDDDKVPAVERRLDLGRNNCKTILGDYWVEY